MFREGDSVELHTPAEQDGGHPGHSQCDRGRTDDCGEDSALYSPRLKQIPLAISTMLDVRSLTLANLAGRLKAAEEVFEKPPSSLNCISLKRSGTCEDLSVMQRSRARAIPVAAVEKETTGTGTGMAVIDLGRQKNAGVVLCWATGIVSAGPNRRKSRPTWFKMKRPS
jgi:hypothetical protein